MAEVPYQHGRTGDTPHLRAETMRLGFTLSEILQRDVDNLLSEEGKQKMGRLPHLLYSDHVETVRRVNGTLRGNNLRMANELQQVIDESRRIQKLARHVTGELIKGIKTQPPLFVLRTGVALDFATVAAMQARPDIPISFRAGRTVPVRLVVPAEAIVEDPGRRRDVLETLTRHILGTKEGRMNFQEESDGVHAYVTDMEMKFRTLRRPRSEK